jgi:hypothetical protein
MERLKEERTTRLVSREEGVWAVGIVVVVVVVLVLLF